MKSKQDYLWEGLLCNVICTPYGAWIPVHRHWTWNACSDVNDCFHCPATELLIDALSQNNVENTSAFDDVTPLTLAEFNKTCTSPTTKLWLMYMDMVMILKRCIHTERAGIWEEYLAELENMLLPSSLWPLQVCILPASLSRSDDRPAYTSSEQLKGIQDGQIIGRQTEAQFNSVWRDMTLENTYIRDAKTNLSLTLVISQQPWRNTGEVLQF